MRIIQPAILTILVALVAACSSSAGGSPAPSTAPDGGASSGTKTSAAPAGSIAGGGAATIAPSQAAGAGAAASQDAGGGGTPIGLAAKPCSLLTEAEVEGVLRGAMVATPKAGRDTVTATCHYASAATGNGVTIAIAEGAAAKTAFDGYAAAGQLGPKVDGIGDAAYYNDGEISIWKGAHGVGIAIEQADDNNDTELRALAVALGKIAARRL